MKIILRRFGHCPPYSDEFIEALHQLTRERGGGYIPMKDIQDRAATLQVVEPMKLPPLPPVLPPLPVILPPLPPL